MLRDCQYRFSYMQADNVTIQNMWGVRFEHFQWLHSLKKCFWQSTLTVHVYYNTTAALDVKDTLLVILAFVKENYYGLRILDWKLEGLDIIDHRSNTSETASSDGCTMWLKEKPASDSRNITFLIRLSQLYGSADAPTPLWAFMCLPWELLLSTLLGFIRGNAS